MSCSITSYEFDFDLALNWTTASVHKTLGNWLKLSLSVKIQSVTCLSNGRISCERLKITKTKTENKHTHNINRQDFMSHGQTVSSAN